MAELSITAVKYAESWINTKEVFEGDQSGEKIPISFTIFLVETAGRRILIDAGCESMAPHWDMRYLLSPHLVLAREGIAPEEITDLIVTHRHHDHVQGVRYFPNAKITMQRLEYEALGGRYIPEGKPVCTFEEELELCEGVRARKIGGHTEGSCIVLLEGGGRTFVVTGDEVYSPICLEKKIAAGNPFSREKSRAFVAEYSGDEYVALVSHDPAFLPGRNGLQKIL